MNLLKNIKSLLITQGASFFVPFILYIYLNKIWNTERLGIFIYINSLISFLMVVSNYGFDISVPHHLVRASFRRYNKCFSAIFFAKIFLFFICAVLFFLFDSSEVTEGRVLILAAVFLNSFSLYWYFQSKNIIYLYSLMQFFSKLILLSSVLFFVRSEKDIFFAFFSIFISSFFLFVLSYAYVFAKDAVIFVKFDLKYFLGLIKKSFPYFASRIGVALYSVAGAFYIGYFSGNMKDVALYGMVHQFYVAAVALIAVVTTPLLPHMIRYKDFELLKKIAFYFLLLFLLIFPFFFFLKKEIFSLFYGFYSIEVNSLLLIFFFSWFFSGMGMIFGYPFLVPVKKAYVANYSVIFAGVFQCVIICILNYIFKIQITALLVAFLYLLCDFFMFAIRFYFYFSIRIRGVND